MIEYERKNKVKRIFARKELRMIGAIIGDIVGSRFEWNNHRSKDFELFGEGCFATDDSIMTVAVAKAVTESGKDYDLLEKNALKKQGKKEIEELDFSKLSLREIFGALDGIYSKACSLAYPSQMYSTGVLASIADRLEQLDKSPEKGGFDFI